MTKVFLVLFDDEARCVDGKVLKGFKEESKANEYAQNCRDRELDNLRKGYESAGKLDEFKKDVKTYTYRTVYSIAEKDDDYWDGNLTMRWYVLGVDVE